MNKKMNRFVPVGILGLIFLVYTAVVLMIFPLDSLSLWVGYGFALLAVLLTGALIWRRVPDMLNAKNEFYESPLMGVCIAYDACAMVLGVVAALVPVVAIQWAALVEFIVAVGFIIAIVLTLQVTNKLRHTQSSADEQLADVRKLENRLRSLADTASDPELSRRIRLLAEDVRFCVPTADASIQAMDSKMAASIRELGDEVEYGNKELALSLVRQLETRLKERNRAVIQADR